jgi:hypothetical protein
MSQQPSPSPFLPYHDADVRRYSLEHPPNYTQNRYLNGMTADQERKQSLMDEDSTGGDYEWWKVAKSWVGDASEKLAEAEKEVWRWANGK